MFYLNIRQSLKKVTIILFAVSRAGLAGFRTRAADCLTDNFLADFVPAKISAARIWRKKLFLYVFVKGPFFKSPAVGRLAFLGISFAYSVLLGTVVKSYYLLNLPPFIKRHAQPPGQSQQNNNNGN